MEPEHPPEPDRATPAGDGALLPGINADVRRQAVASLGGYAYQIWRSVLAWLDLRAGHAIDLEGNEDIDLLFPGGAVSTQVKAMKDPITLRSADVIEVINNCWLAQERNPGLPLTLRFLCTAGSTFEKERPFGDRHGLQVWQSLQRRPSTEVATDGLAKLRAFLLTLSGLDVGLKSWLGSVSDEEITARLIDGLVWDLNADSSETIQTLIDDQLALLGESYGVYPSDAAKVRPLLLQEALKKATTTDPRNRRLDRAQLLKLFEAETAFTVPRNSLVAAMARTPAPFATTAAGAVAEGQQVVAALRRTGLILPSGMLVRRKEVEAIQGAVGRHGLVYVSGSTGMGKSTLIQQAIGGLSPDAIWLDFRDAERDAPKLLRQIAATVNLQGLKVNLVLDDLNFAGDSRALQAALEMLLVAVSSRGGLIFVTGAAPPPSAWLLKLGRDDSVIVGASRFDEEGVDELLGLQGMTAGQNRTAWARLVVVHTSGHPQLVHARVAALKSRGFPRISETDLLPGPNDVQEVKEQARRIVSELPQADRDLLYRLSLTTGRLRRSAILKIARLNPAISEAGNALDRLAGPWIERVSDDYYRISPLVQGTGIAVHGQAWAGPVHMAIARSLLDPVLTPEDASAILLHAMAGGDELVLVKMCNTLLSAEKRKLVYDWLTWFLYVETKAFNIWHTRVVVRMVQFAIAAETEPLKAVEYAEKLERESRLAENADTVSRVARFMAVSSLLITASARLPARMIVSAAIEADALSASRQQLVGQARELAEDDEVLDEPNVFEVGMAIVVSTQGRIATHRDLKEFLEELDKVPALARDRLIAKLGHDSFAAAHVVNTTWLHEWRAEKPEWLPLMASLQECLTIALRWNATALAAAIGTVMVRTTNENLKLPLEARQIGETLAGTVGEVPELIDAIADTFDAEGRPDEALKLRERVMPRWLPTEHDVLSPIIGRRKVAISASKAGQWATAARFLREASTFTRPDDRVLHVGLLFDAAFSDLKAGQGSDAIDRFLDAIDLLRSVPNTRDNPAAFRLHKVAGNMLTVMSGSDDVKPPGQELAEITPACCSDSFIHDELLNLPSTPVDLTALNLCRYCVRASLVSPRISALLRSYRTAKVTLFRLLAMNVEAAHAVLSSNLDDVPQRALALSRVLAQANKAGRGAEVMAESAPASETDPGDLRFVQTYLVSALLVSVESGSPLSIPTSWRAQISPPVLPPDAVTWLENLQQLLDRPLSERIARVGQHADLHELGALELSIAIDPAVGAKPALRAHVHLHRLIQQKTLLPEVAPHLSRLISRFWFEQAQNRFALISPRTTQPALLEACALTEEGLSKSACLLLAASEAIGGSLPIDISRDLIAAKQ